MTDTPLTRASLILRLRDLEDQNAWVEFVRLYEPVVYRVIRRHGLQEMDAQDLLQELFIAVARHVGNWEPVKESRSFRSWLRRVTRNLVLNWLKQKERREVAVGGSDMVRLLTMEPDLSTDSNEFDKELRRGLFKLAAEQVKEQVQPETWRAFWQTAVVGVSAAITAKEMGMEIGAVRVARCRVLSRLRAEVKRLEST